MDLTNLKTNRGAVVSIHRGKITTTNLWWESGWYIIVDPQVIQVLGEICNAEQAGRPDEAERKALDLRTAYPVVSNIGQPYRRQGSSARPATPTSQTQQQPQQQTQQQTTSGIDPTELKNRKQSIADRLIKFFSEFNFAPSPRFTNTLMANVKSLKKAQQYVGNYFKLIGHMYYTQVRDKVKSDEFKTIVSDMQYIQSYCTIQVNKRLEIKFGPAGGGKTTAAMVQNPNAKVIVCAGTMDATDLMEAFDFNDQNGNPQFKPSELQMAMINGETIILDELANLPIDTLRFAQGFLDSKEEFYYKGKLIKIHPNFKVVATMNDIITGQDVILPEPIVDRAMSLEYYELDAESLAKYAF